MPRKARLDIPDLLQHVIVRGIERTIIINDDDRSMFIKRFSSLLDETGTDCYAWVLIPNHFRLLLHPHQISLSSFMRRLLTGYAINFNYSHRGSGHLFQNRYKAIVCEEETYFLELVRYIHLTPLRARLDTKISLLVLLERIAKMYGIDESEFRWRSKMTKQSEARAVFFYSAVRLLRVSGKDVGKNVKHGTICRKPSY